MSEPTVDGFPPYATLTPIMQQYVRLKSKAPDCLLFFRLGDFYELFGPDALRAGELLGITVTSRDRDKENGLPMAGVPHHAATGYLAKLMELGVRVAIAEQMQDPATTKGMVDRDIVRILTPGTILEEELLASPRGNYLALLSAEPGWYGLALCDLSTATLLVAEEARPLDDMDVEGQLRALESILGHARRFEATELLTPATEGIPEHARRGFAHGTYIPHGIGAAWARERIAQQLQTKDVSEQPFAARDACAVAVAETLRVIERLAPLSLGALTRFTLLAPAEHLALDQGTVTNLELLANAGTGKVAGSLLGILDQTRTPMGRRLLRQTVVLPLRSATRIRARLEAVRELIASSLTRERIREGLRPVKDMARALSRAQAGIATPRDCLALLESLQALPLLIRDAGALKAPLLREHAALLGDHGSLTAQLLAALHPEAPGQFQAGRVIKRGYAGELDQLRDVAANSKEVLDRLEASERSRSGLKLKVGYNRVHGYYFEIPKSQKAQVPPDWHARQSLVNAERFVTQELKDVESQVLGAEERARELELGLFKALVDRIASEAPALRATIDALAWLDLLTTFAQVAAEKRWVEPVTLDEQAIHLIDCRHPVLEELLGAHQFVPNDAHFEPEGSQINILTGPNMAGKSTYMRQVALCCLLHQLGSFVPAKEARLGLFDRILTRAGATDDLARGQSTFMVEMVETAAILHTATPESLVLLDEIGRGTSTYDGLALAWAIAEYLHNTPTCRPLTLFATHYHELTQLAEYYPAITNWRVLLKEQDGQIIFLRRVAPGRAQKSYGVVVARLAGLPPSLVDRAGVILEQLAHQQIDPKIEAAPVGPRGSVKWRAKDETLDLFGEGTPRQEV